MRVAMLVANDVTVDARVLKSAAAVASAGAAVTVFGIARGRDRLEVPRAGFSVVRLPLSVTARRPAINAAREDDRRRAALQDEVAAEALRLQVLDQLRPPHGPTVGQRIGQAQTRRRLRRLHRQQAPAEPGPLRSGRADGHGRWWRDLPIVIEYHEAVWPELCAFAPDVIHAHDVHFLASAVSFARARAAEGATVRVVYDAHEWVEGMSVTDTRTPRIISAWADLERQFIAGADRVVTVSAGLSDLLRTRYRLDEEPAVVLNTPRRPRGSARGRGSGKEPTRRIRDVCLLPDSVPLLVYSGILAPGRGVDLAIDALEHLPDAHLAIVCVPSSSAPAALPLIARAEERAWRDRVHFLQPVASDDVVEFLRGADVGLLPFRRFPSHEVALANKLFEYTFAGLSVVVSDLPAQAAFVQSHGLGAVHATDDARALAESVRRVLARGRESRPRMSDDLLSQYCWERQARMLMWVYDDLAATIPESDTEHQPEPRLDSRPSPPLHRPSDSEPTAVPDLQSVVEKGAADGQENHSAAGAGAPAGDVVEDAAPKADVGCADDASDRGRDCWERVTALSAILARDPAAGSAIGELERLLDRMAEERTSG